ncbi:MAG: hypothetical protein P8M72_08345 [Gammaproteobacteria bacterium]|nr:hypothetical protein [Gammaproteobacteria bacterium]
MSYAYEKRDFERVKTDATVILYYGAPSKEVAGICINIGDCGLGLELSAIVPIGTECQVKVHDGHQNAGPFQALVEIKHILPLSKGRCQVGAAILEMF